MNHIFLFFLMIAAPACYGAETHYTEETFYHEFFQMLLTLGVLLTLLIGGTWLMKRMLNSRQRFANTNSTIKIVEQRSLSTKSALYLVEVYDKTLLVGEGQNGVVTLAEFDGALRETHTDVQSQI